MTPTEARKALEEATRATIIAHLAKYVSREDDGSDEPAEGSDFCGYLTFDGLDNLSAALSPQETPGPSVGDGELIAADFLRHLREVNSARLAAWEGDNPADALFHATELGGEVGEVLNVAKKLHREAMGWRGSRATVEQLGDEIGDVLICLDKLASFYGIGLAAVTTAKFNATSDKVGLPHRLQALSSVPPAAPSDTLSALLSQASTAGLYCTVGHTPPSDAHRTPPAPERRYSAHVSGREGSTDAEAATLVDALRDALAAYGGGPTPPDAAELEGPR